MQEEKEAHLVKQRRAISILIALPPRHFPGSPSLGVGRRATPSIIVDDRGRLVSQFGWWIRVLGMVVSHHLIMGHVVVVRRAGSYGERVNRNRL